MATVIKVKGDASGIETDFEHVKPGMFFLKVAEISQRQSKNDEPMAEIIFVPTKDGNGKKLKVKNPARLYYYVPLDPAATWARRLKEFLVAFGLPMKGADLAKAVNKEALARLKEDTDQDGEYRPRITKLLKPGSNGASAEVDEDEDEPEAEADEDEEAEPYTEEELVALSNDDLREVAGEFEVTVPKRLTTKSKPELIAAILEAQDGEDEDEDEEDEDEEDEETRDLDSLSRAELKALIKEEGLDVKVMKKDDDDALREKVREALGEEEDEDEDEDEGDNYDQMSLADLRQECDDRELDSKGKKPILIARLRTDDADEPV